MTQKTQYIDLSHDIFDGLTTYKGLPPPVICDYLSRETSKAMYGGKHEVQIGQINMVSNTGTYLDCAFHFDENGGDLSTLALQQLAGLNAFVVNANKADIIDASYFEYLRGKIEGAAILVNTQWSQHWNTAQYFENHPSLTECAAIFLQEQNVALVGIDSHNIDDTRGQLRPVHQHLLSHNILICEHLCNLEKLPNDGFLFTAAPPKIKGMGTFPVRAYASI